MSYTASALSFMLRNLAKPVLITGSQMPIWKPRTDAIQNFVTALQIAAGETTPAAALPEVCLAFRNHLFRGCRTTKVSAASYDAFQSPNYPELGLVGKNIQLYPDRIQLPSPGAFHIEDRLSRGVIIIRVSPGLDADVFKAVLDQPKVRGVVLETYGAGNVPMNRDILSVLESAIVQGKHVVNVTQCLSGGVELGLYASSAALRDLGVVSGLDMTAEAAVTKLQVLLGEYGDDYETVSQRMQVNIVGERSLSVFNARFGGGTAKDRYESETAEVSGEFSASSVRTAQLRLLRVRCAPPCDAGHSVRVYLNLRRGDTEAQESAPQHAGTLQCPASTSQVEESLAIDVTKVVRKGVVTSGRPVCFTLVNPANTSVTWDRADLAIVSDS
jgi:L-asparaginase